MSVKFLKSINRVLSNEGGYVNNPKDPGGETNWGISKRSYPNVDIKSLTRNQAIAIYYRDFWLKIHGDEVADGVAFQLLDAAVNHGVQQAIRFGQRALNVADDGYWGPVTLEAMRNISESRFINRYLAQRLRFYTKLSTWPSSGKGWVNRIAENLDYAAEDI